MLQNCGLAKCGIHQGLGIFQILRVHLRAHIAASCDVRLVHLRCVQLGIGHNYQMMGRASRITAIPPVIHVHDSPDSAADLPVIAQEESLECAVGNVGLLFGSQSRSQILAAERVLTNLQRGAGIQNSPQSIIHRDSLVSCGCVEHKFVCLSDSRRLSQIGHVHHC